MQILETMDIIIKLEVKGMQRTATELSNAYVKLWDQLILAMWPGPTADADFIVRPIPTGKALPFNTLRRKVMFRYLRKVWQHTLLRHEGSAEERRMELLQFKKQRDGLREKFHYRVSSHFLYSADFLPSHSSILKKICLNSTHGRTNFRQIYKFCEKNFLPSSSNL